MASYNTDNNNYRIREEFRDFLNGIEANNFIRKIDISSLKNINYFDHCHLDNIGHKELAEEIQAVINIDVSEKKDTAKMRNILFNPEYSFGNDQSFNDYFQIVNNNNINISHELDKVFIETLNEGDQKLQIINKIDKNLFNSINTYLMHPIFVDLNFIKSTSNFYNHYYGKFPELYLISLIQQIF